MVDPTGLGVQLLFSYKELSTHWRLTLNASFFPLSAFVLFMTALLIAAVQPFKTSLPHYNLISTILTQFFAFFALCLTGMIFSELYFKPKVQSFWLYLSLIFGTAPLGYVLICVCIWAIKNWNVGCVLVKKTHAWRKGYSGMPESFDEDGFSDRINHPEYYSRNNSLNSFSVNVAN